MKISLAFDSLKIKYCFYLYCFSNTVKWFSERWCIVDKLRTFTQQHILKLIFLINLKNNLNMDTTDFYNFNYIDLKIQLETQRQILNMVLIIYCLAKISNYNSIFGIIVLTKNINFFTIYMLETLRKITFKSKNI